MSDDLLSLARPEIVAMEAYRSARNEQSSGKIWLDANENPCDFSEAQQYNRYPEQQPAELISCFSSLYQVAADHVLVTRGSDEGIDLLVRGFCRAGRDQIMICPPTYGMYQIAATVQQAGVVSVPLVKEKNFALDTGKIIENWQSMVKLIFLCSPNNPTGNLLSSDDILSLCQKLNNKSLVAVDEAYIEFSKTESLVKNLADYPNLVILRTLSKAYGLAGIRCGVLLANPVIIQLLKKVIAPYPISRPVVDIVVQRLSLENLAKVHEQINIIRQEKELLFEFFSTISRIKMVWDSASNFLLLEVDNVKSMMAALQQHGIVVRDRSYYAQLNNCIRITVGDPQENTVLREVLANV